MKLIHSCALTLSLIVGFGATQAFALSDKICAQKYDDCSKNIFKQSKCKKELKKCSAAVDKQQAREAAMANQQDPMKNRMMTGQRQPAGQSMRDKMHAQNNTQEPAYVDPKEAARQRLQEREAAQDAAATPAAPAQPSMRDRMKSSAQQQ